MTSLARHTALRYTGPHRNLPHVFRGQLRHIHETAEKAVFRWEVRIRPPRPAGSIFVGILNGHIEPLGPSGTRKSTLWRGNRNSVCTVSVLVVFPTAERSTAMPLGSSVRRVHFVTTAHGPSLMHQ